MIPKKYLALFSLVIILSFIGYIIYDSIRPAGGSVDKSEDEAGVEKYPDNWRVLREIFIRKGLKAVAVARSGDIYVGGDSFLSRYDGGLNEVWKLDTPEKIGAVAVYGDTVFAASEELIFLVGTDGKMINELGPYESNSLITSVSANKEYIAIADAGNKIVFILTRDGEVISMIGHFGEKLLIPSPYFDVALTDDNSLFMANTGNFRIEKRKLTGEIISSFGESGIEPGEFCGCCNPAHFTVIPQGFVTAEKGINRIKIMNLQGEFAEFVSADNDFSPSAPLDVASADGKTIYAANPADSKLYIFVKK